MSFGIQLINSSGITVIDSNYSNFHVVYSNVVTSNVNTSTYVSYPTQPTIPIVVVNFNSANAAVFCVSAVGLNGFYIRHVGTPNNLQINYAVLQPLTNFAPSSGYGVQVFDQGGNVVFDSNKNYFIIDGHTLVNYVFNTNTLTNNIISSLPSRNDRYVSINNALRVGIGPPTGGGGNYHKFLAVMLQNTTSVTVTTAIIPGPPGYPAGANTRRSFMSCVPFPNS